MLLFEKTKELTETCYAAVQNPAYPIQLISGRNDPFLPYKEYGVQFEKARPGIKSYEVEAKHFLQEEHYTFIAQQVKAIATEAM
jgi:pimeloyl-ACP methyl ester carboxylesterase